MDEVAMLNQMAMFDFSKPIVKTFFFEDDEYLCKNEIELVDKHSQDCFNIEENSEMKNIECSTTVLNEEFQNDIDVTVTEQNLLKSGNNLGNTAIDSHTQIQTNDVNSTGTDFDGSHNIVTVDNPNFVVNAKIANELTRKTIINDSEIYQHLTDGDELNKNLQKDLDKISDNLVRIMIPYYHYSYKNQRNDRLSEWEFKKIYYFVLSYDIVVTLMLPREKNKIFVKKFLDRTIAHACTMYKLRFETHDVEPFYNELIQWSKHRREKENSQNKINNSNNPNQLKGNDGNKKKINSKKINKDKHGDNCIPDMRNRISFIEQRIDNNSINQNERINYNEISCNNICDDRINDQRQEISDANTINSRLINNEINISGMHGTKDISIRRYESVIVENGINRSNSIDNTITSSETGLDENNPINENRTLATRLVDPPQPVNFSHSTVAPIPSLNLNSNNSTCIFSGGDPGKEISINVSSDVLDHAKKQQDIQNIHNLISRLQSKENYIVHPPNAELAPKQVSCKNGGQLRSVQQSNISYKPVQLPRPPRPPPPPYSNSIHNILAPVPQANNYNIAPAPNIAQMTQDQPQKNINAYSAPEQNHWKLGQMYNAQIEQQAATPTSKPTSCQNTAISTTLRITGPCNFCGKPAHKICSKCIKISYCSKICQELHTDYIARLRHMISNQE